MDQEQVGAAGTSAMPVLQVGSTGDAVRQLQHLLNQASNAGLAEDGEFGPATDHAVRSFQSAHGLEADGVVGPKTWAALLGGSQGTGGCVNGWTVPPFGSELRKHPPRSDAPASGFTSQFEVPDIRYVAAHQLPGDFTGCLDGT